MLDASRPLDEQDEELLKLTENKNRILVYNKTDIAPINEGVAISAKTNELKPLIQEIERLFEKHLIAVEEPALNNERQIALMNRALQSMNQAITAMNSGMELDLVTIDLQDAYTSLKEILGEVSRDDLLDTLFSNFCLGK